MGVAVCVIVVGRFCSSMLGRWGRWLTVRIVSWVTRILRGLRAYHAWRSRDGSWRGRGGSRTAPTSGTEYEDVAGFCKSASLEEVRKHGHVLTPGRYVGVEAVEDDGEPFEEKMARLTSVWREQSREARRLDDEIESNLAEFGVLKHCLTSRELRKFK